MSQVISIGEGVLFVPDDDRYSYRFWRSKRTPEWSILLRDDGYRIHGIFISEKPVNPPRGEREWRLLWEYKHSDGPQVDEFVDLIMGRETQELRKSAD